ncbi:MAG: AmmeMemoRadiSam system radical SAM enzyme [Treponema sp.]|nr:AmmeMemoRadiSam system radical SAM enzyme [Treponema sp.]
MPQRRFFMALGEATLQCTLCPRGCVIPPGGRGRCGVRGNQEGREELAYYGTVTALQIDPIEKKPLYHYHPGSRIFSVGFAGCNLQCPFCQNWHISQITGRELLPRFSLRSCSPEALVKAAQAEQVLQIAYTYTEPLIHLEFLRDCMTCAREAGIANVLVSNGCINPEAAQIILDLTDAANIDLKCFSEDTYRRILGGDLSTVLDFITQAWKTGVHLELTTLVVPGLNDQDEEIDRCIAFLASLSPHIPWHLSAYHPAYTWNAPPTDPKRLMSLTYRARETLSYVYTGNIASAFSSTSSTQDTICPHCGQTLIRRQGYRIQNTGFVLHGSGPRCPVHCGYCGKAVPIVGYVG